MKNPETTIGELANTTTGGLTVWSRVLAGLRIGAQYASPFVWRHYLALAERLGLTRNQVIWVAAVGPRAFQGHHAAVLWTVDHTVARRTVHAEAQREVAEAAVSSVRTAVMFDHAVARLTKGVEPELAEAPFGLGTPAEAVGAYAEQTGERVGVRTGTSWHTLPSQHPSWRVARDAKLRHGS